MAHDAAGPAAAALRARLLDQETRVRALLADIHRLQQPPPANAEDSSLHPHAHSRTHSPNVRTAASTPAQQSMALTVAMSSSPGAAVPACAVPYPPIPRAPRLSSAAPPIVTSLAQSAILSKPLSAASDDSPMADAASENGDNKTTVASSSSSEEKRRFRKTCLMIWSKLAEHRFGNVFTRAEKSAYYLSVIKNPTNLTMIKNRIRDGEISSMDEFHRDILLMLANAVMFNDENSEIYLMAQSLRVFIQEELAAIENVRRMSLLLDGGHE